MWTIPPDRPVTDADLPGADLVCATVVIHVTEAMYQGDDGWDELELLLEQYWDVLGDGSSCNDERGTFLWYGGLELGADRRARTLELLEALRQAGLRVEIYRGFASVPTSDEFSDAFPGLVHRGPAHLYER